MNQNSPVDDPSVPNGTAQPLTGLLVVEHGERLGAAVCGTLLAQLGAEVVIIERAGEPAPRNKWTCRASNALGKRSLVPREGDPEDDALLGKLLRAADIVVVSSDVSPPLRHLPQP